MKVEMIQQATAGVLFDVPDEVQQEVIMLIEAVAKRSKTVDPAAAFGEWCRLVHAHRGDVVELDVGWAR